MHKFFARVWSAFNSPVADIIGGLLFFALGVCVCVYRGTMFDRLSCCAGFALAVGLDVYDHGLHRLFCMRKHPQGPPSKDCQP